MRTPFIIWAFSSSFSSVKDIPRWPQTRAEEGFWHTQGGRDQNYLPMQFSCPFCSAQAQHKFIIYSDSSIQLKTFRHPTEPSSYGSLSGSSNISGAISPLQRAMPYSRIVGPSIWFFQWASHKLWTASFPTTDTSSILESARKYTPRGCLLAL